MLYSVEEDSLPTVLDQEVDVETELSGSEHHSRMKTKEMMLQVFSHMSSRMIESH